MSGNSSPPIEPRRREAPTTATDAGRKNGRSDAATATWSRSSTRLRKPGVASIGKATSTSPWSSRRVTSKPASANTESIGRLSCRTSARLHCRPAARGRNVPGAARLRLRARPDSVAGKPHAGAEPDSAVALALQQSLLERVADELGARLQAELLHDVRAVRLGRADRDVEHPRDLLVRMAEGEQAEDVALAVG